MKILLIQLFFVFSFSLQVIAMPLILNKKEKAFIKNSPTIKIAMMPDFAPFSYYLDNKPIGFEHDLLNIISKKTGLNFEKHINNWTTNYNALKNKEVDMISSISYKEYREDFTNFTNPYYNIPIMIFVKDDFGEYKGPQSLIGKKVGVIRDIFYIKELKKLGSLDLIYYDSYEKLVKDLVFGKIDALIQNLTIINYYIKKHVYSNITLASELVLPNTKKEDLRFGVHPDKPLLNSILQKALTSISKKEKETLINKWIGSIKVYTEGHIELKEDEIAYVNTKRIKYCINPEGLPFEGLSEKGEHIGMSSDYYNLFSRMLSAKFELVKTTSWNQSLAYIKEKKCDMLALGMETQQRKEYLNFTSHYLKVPLVVATRVDVPFINQILDLEDEKIGLIKGDAFVKILRQKYPSLNIIEVDDIYEGLDKVKDGQLFAFIDTLASIGYEFQNKYFGELKIAGKISEELKLSIAIRKDDIILLNILQKVVNNITKELHRKILTKWIPIKYEKEINYTLILQIALALIFILLFVIYWNTKITKANKLLKQAQKDIEEKNKELNKLAITDKLTNLYNRRKIEEILQNELNKSVRFSYTFCFCILDIDHFKNVNDQYGHQIGDHVLIEIANILKNNLRETDFAGRYGGEEFVIICPQSKIEDIITLINNLKVKIALHDFKNVKNQTASFGLTESKVKDNMDSLIKRADKALYDAKNSGRNKLVVAP